MPDTTKATEATTEIAAVMVDLNRGRFSDDCTAALAQVVKGVVQHGGKGKLIMTIEVEQQDPKTFEDDGVMLLTPKVETKVPARPHAPAVFYSAGGGALTRDDPQRDQLGA
jgi:hypothetical protein